MTERELESIGNRDGVFVVRKYHTAIISLIIAMLGGLVAWSDRNSASASGLAELKMQVNQNTTAIRESKPDRDLLVGMSTKIAYIEQAVRGLEARERERDK